VKPDATLTLHNEVTHNEVTHNVVSHNEATIVWTTMRDFSKIGLQLVQQAHGNTGRSKRFVIKNAAHGYWLLVIGYLI
jgi:transcription elongation GreA/GreB family factor